MRRIIITLSVVVCMIISMVAYAAFADSGSVPFSTSVRTRVVTVTNNSGSSKTLSAKASLTSGSGGVWVQICNTSGTTVYAQKLFPYQDQSLSPVTNTVAAGAKRGIYVKPNTSGQTVTGSLIYSI